MSAPRRRRVEADGLARPGKGERRRALLAAAKQLFARHGYSTTTLPQIAAAAGLTPAQATRSFSDKPAYLRAIFADLIAVIVPPSVNGIDVLSQIHATADRLLESAVPELRVLLRVLANPHLDDADAAVVRWGLPELMDALSRVVLEGQQAGVLRRSPDALTAAADVFQALLGYLLVQPYFQPDDAAAADRSAAALDGLLHGLLKTDV